MSEQILNATASVPRLEATWSNRSTTLAKLADALAKAQGAMLNASKGMENPFFHSRYADLASVWDACRGPLSANGLCVIQLPTIPCKPGNVAMETLLLHSSGEWVSATLVLTPTKGDPQSIGSCMTYIRRYALQAMVGIAAEDDDGNAASGNGNDGGESRAAHKGRESRTIEPPRAPGPALPLTSGPVATSSSSPLSTTSAQASKPLAAAAADLINEAQRKRFYVICDKANWQTDDVKKMLADFGISSSTQITKKDYDRICGIVQSQTYAEYLDFKNNPPPSAVAG